MSFLVIFKTWRQDFKLVQTGILKRQLPRKTIILGEGENIHFWLFDVIYSENTVRWSVSESWRPHLTLRGSLASGVRRATCPSTPARRGRLRRSSSEARTPKATGRTSPLWGWPPRPRAPSSPPRCLCRRGRWGRTESARWRWGSGPCWESPPLKSLSLKSTMLLER